MMMMCTSGTTGNSTSSPTGHILHYWGLEKKRTLPRSPPQARPHRVWNGIFAAGDWRAKRGLKTMSPRRDRKSETTTREKWPQKRLFC